jgi:WD40 repeat protein
MLGVLGAQQRKDMSLIPGWRGRVGDHIIDLRWSDDGEWLAAASVSGSIHVFEGRSGKPVITLPGHRFGTISIAWRPGSRELASGGQDGKIRIWIVSAGEEHLVLDGGSEWVERIAWSPSGKYLASAAGRSLRVWLPDGSLLRENPPHPSTIADTAWKPGADELAVAGYGLISFWNPAVNEPIREFHWKGSMLTIAWSPDAKYLSTGNQDATVHFWILKTGKDLHMYGYPGKIRELAWDPSSRYLATGGSTKVVVWDCSGKGPANTKPLDLDLHQVALTQLAYQHHGSLLASGCRDGVVAIWNPAKSTAPVSLVSLDSGVTRLAWSPSDKAISAGDVTGHLTVFHSPA